MRRKKLIKKIQKNMEFLRNSSEITRMQWDRIFAYNIDSCAILSVIGFVLYVIFINNYLNDHTRFETILKFSIFFIFIILFMLPIAFEFIHYYFAFHFLDKRYKGKEIIRKKYGHYDHCSYVEFLINEAKEELEYYEL